MKRLTLSLAQLVLCAYTFSLCAATPASFVTHETTVSTCSTTPVEKASVTRWKDNKYSMFIHFGI